jgi:streptogramin lyase
MRSLVPKLLTAAIVLLAALAWVPTAGAAPAVNGIFPLATEVETNNKIAQGPDGNMWFTLFDPTHTKDVGMITPAGAVHEFELPGVEEVPFGIAAGPDGRLWVPTTNKVTSFLPMDPKGTEQTFTVPTINGEGEIVAGPDGQMWVASKNSLVHFSTSNPPGATSVSLVGEFTPKDIDVAGSNIVVADNSGGAEKPRVDVFTTAGVETKFDIPGMTQGVAGAPTGQIAYTAPGAAPEQVGLITPPTASPPFELLNDPFGVTYGSDQAFWVAQFAGTVTRVTSTGAHTTLAGLPKESPRQIAAGPGNTLWITLIKKEESGVPISAIARIIGLEAPPTPTPTPPGGPITVTEKPVPNTRIGKGPKKVVKTTGAKATVKFSFSSTVAGSTFQCKLTKVPAGKKKKAKGSRVVFAGCSSPRVLKLAPGKYRFAVRAVAAGVIDGSPAEKAFRVIRVPRHR